MKAVVFDRCGGPEVLEYREVPDPRRGPDEVVVEVKSLRSLPEAAVAQTLSYLRATGLKRGLLINFGEKRLVDGIKRLSL